MSDVRPLREDPMGEALDRSEAIQRQALEEARLAVREAVAALRPFERHSDRVLPGIAKAVETVKGALEESAEHLAKIVSAHLDHVDEPVDSTITERVDTEHAARVAAEKVSA